MAQCVREDRVVLWDRRRAGSSTTTRASAPSGASIPAAVADRLALVGDASDGYPGIPGWGAKSASAVLARYGSIDAIPEPGPGIGTCRRCVASRPSPLRSLTITTRSALYRELARLRTDAPLPQREPDELHWHGMPRAAWKRFCDQWGLERLRDRPHRWSDRG